MKKLFYVRIGKRCFDIASSICGIFLISPLLVSVGLAVKLSSRGPVIFRQIRVGQFGKAFRMFKFRSMRTEGEHGSKLTASGDPRVTPLGAWLRRTKIDELPQLFNVVLGDMSLVGPRPEVPEFAEQFGEKQRAILNARPGITGPSANVYEEELLADHKDIEKFYVTTVLPAKLEIDLRYCQNITFRTDLYILYQTFAKMLTRLYEPYKRVPYPARTLFEIRAIKDNKGISAKS
jgi:lipopolysaccharide/colanic/teichoic acid biosynthesis glycosyltransferase